MADEKLEQLVVRLDRQTIDGLRRWAEDEDRTMAQQVRRVIKAEMPAKYAKAFCPTSPTGHPDGCRCVEQASPSAARTTDEP